MPWFTHEAPSISRGTVRQLCERLLDEARARLKTPRLKRVLLLPPDLTRAHSGAGWITEMFYSLLPDAEVHVIPTLGQHVPHTEAENKWMFGSIPAGRIHEHRWRDGVTHLGSVSAEFVAQATNGTADWEIPVAINSMTVAEPWDLIINIGHVVPHEVLGFANHNKNYFIGLGGKPTICASHLASAVYGIENNLGNLLTPVRQCFNEAERQFLSRLPDVYFQVVMARDGSGRLGHTGVYVGDDLETYLAAARASRAQNITLLEKPVEKIVAFMQPDEFRATWVANKAVYRTRMAMADAGELLIVAPGVERFGEQPEVDALIRKYGYCGTPAALERYRENEDMRNLAHATAHLLHGSSEGRFTIRYATDKLTRRDLESVHYQHADLRQTLARYNPETLREGFNTMPDGEEVYYISSPSAGLWATRERMAAREAGA
ncbi:MAG: lactate racemase domain-containing protein [Kiritimatiellaeota bacterium]|nr:lactate racemase domain-containing protein [Kiritimatiellota bacterium]